MWMKLTLKGKNVDLYSKYENERTSRNKDIFLLNKTHLFKAKNIELDVTVIYMLKCNNWIHHCVLLKYSFLLDYLIIPYVFFDLIISIYAYLFWFFEKFNKGFHFQGNRTRGKKGHPKNMQWNGWKIKREKYIYTWRGLELSNWFKPSTTYTFRSRPWKELESRNIPSKAIKGVATRKELWRFKNTSSLQDICASNATNFGCWLPSKANTHH